MNRWRLIRISLWGATGLVAIAALAVTLPQFLSVSPTQLVKASNQAVITAEFSLVSHAGEPVTQENFRGQWLLIFFGFTHCPDVCPTTLNDISEVMDALGAKAREVQPLFVTVDPERDTPVAMAEYVSAFHPRIIGLTGSTQQVKQAAKNFRVYFQKVVQAEVADGYSMDHSTLLFLLNPDGGLETFFTYATPPEDIVARLEEIL